METEAEDLQGGGRMYDLSVPEFRANEVRLWPIVICHNLGNLWPGGVLESP
jgi:hypothetical protein